ncbi:chromate transporter [Peptoniphilus sp. MSJ-1]|uniref:Chromate transporter n=1 Tax=Peptoniphilus ovalis TaxID=2841503 RepID=A0ABS6FDR5_9FIRM|nr:chromate transporter [Peptoniphilus ovalis]MBU5668307.1 chromate transporter [Peptoniphilus ovalis]
MKDISLFKLFMTFFKINAITFGGGYTIVPVIKDIFVSDLNLIDEDEMLDIVAISQGGPGAMAISCSVLTGYKLKGPVGAVTCLVASSLPCLIILSVISNFYQEFKSNFYINAALEGISGIISAVLFITVFNMAKSSYAKNPRFTVIMMIASFILGFFTNINTGLIILFCAIAGISYFGAMERSKNV